MKKSDFLYFNFFDYLDPSFNKLIIEEISFFDNLTSTIISTDGSLTDTIPASKGHIRNNQLSEIVLDTILPNGIKNFKNQTKELIKSKGFVLPVLRGINNYKNPVSMKWHKDFINPDMYIDNKKRIVTFYVATDNTAVDATFMVSPNADGPGAWNLGFKLNLVNNLLIGHNQNLGHEYQINTQPNVNILSLLWYDLG